MKTGSGVLVVDIDVKAGKQGAESFTALGLTPAEKDTFRVKTASGGWHVYYSYDPVLAFGSNAGRLGPGLDVRADGGYVVGPGSVLTNGSGQGSYVVENDWPTLHNSSRRDSTASFRSPFSRGKIDAASR